MSTLALHSSNLQPAKLYAGSSNPGGSRGSASHGAERLLAEALDRAMRAPQGRAVLALHLSRLTRPAPGPHHIRIAQAVLQDAAQRHHGQIFSLGNGDLALLCRRAGLAGEGAETLPAILLRLFRADLPDAGRLLSLWSLEEPVAGLHAWVAERLADPPVAPPTEMRSEARPEPRAATARLEAIEAAIDDAPVPDLAQRQTAVLALPGEAILRPIFRELTFAVPAIEARVAVADGATLDPFLFRHLASRLDARMLDFLTRALRQGTPTQGTSTQGTSTQGTSTQGTSTLGTSTLGTPALGQRGGPALHINLTLPGILSDAFTDFAAACRTAGLAAGAEVALTEICADHDSFEAASRRVRAAGLRLVVDGVSHLALLLTAPEALRADMLKLEWSPRLPALGGADRAALAAAIARIGPGRIVLRRAETERAIEWGLRNGIRRFQGRQVDAMLAASRMRECTAAKPGTARGCTLGQCIERARALSPVPRSLCGNRALLDGATVVTA